MLLHDTHAHLDMLLQKLGLLTDYPELDLQTADPEIIRKTDYDRSRLDELLTKQEFIFQSCVTAKNLLSSVYLFEHNPKVKFLLGSHPDMVKEGFDLREYLRENKEIVNIYKGESKATPKSTISKVLQERLVGIGEIGLDYYWVKEGKYQKIQQTLFESQIQLALELDLPIEIHTREAFEDTISILRNFPQIHGKFVIHCFTGSLENLRQVLELGGKVGYGGIITFGQNAEYLRETVSYCPEENFLLETDLPFLAPKPHRGKTCLPEYISYVGEKIGEIKGLDSDKVWERGRKNAQAIFEGKNNFHKISNS
jgi:TatD DNase family protein